MTEALIGLAAGLTLWFVTRTVALAVLKSRMRRKVSEVPGGAEAFDAAWADRTKPVLPKDPTALTTFVRVPPVDGTPGEEFWAPGPSAWSGRTGPDGSRSDAAIHLTSTAAILVVRAGRVAERGPAHLRPDRAAAELPQGARRLGTVVHVQTGAGPAYRHTVDHGLTRVTDWHLDYAGFAFIVGFLRKPQDEHLGAVMEHVFASWRWLPAEDGDEVRADAVRV